MEKDQERWVSLAVPVVLGAVLLAVVWGSFQVYRNRIAQSASKIVSTPNVSAADLESLLEKYPHSDAAQVARMKLGKKAFDQKQWDDAIRWYASVSDSADPMLYISALHNEALAYVKKNDTEKALSLLRQARQDKANQDPDYSDLLTAHVYETSGQTDKASALYKSLSEGTKDSFIQGEAKERLSLNTQKDASK